MWQQYRLQPRLPFRAIDLNEAVYEAVEALRRQFPAEGTAPLSLELSPDSPVVSGSVADLKRLCSFLIKNAILVCSSNTGKVTVRTTSAGSSVRLEVEDTGPQIDAEMLQHIFDPGKVCREGTNSLELAACSKLAQRLHGKIEVQNRLKGGVVAALDLPAAQLISK